MDKIVNKVVMLIQGQVYTIDDTTRIYTCTTDSVGTQQEIHNNRATRRYTTGETTEKLLSEKFRSDVRAYRKKRHQVLISFSHFWPEHYIITSRI